MEDIERLDLKFSRIDKESNRHTILYEIRMLRFCLEWLNKNGPDHLPEEEMWAILESFLLHYRNLANYLSGRGGKKGDLSMSVPKHWSEEGFTKTKVEAIKKAASGAFKEYSSKISTYLAHCTRQRYDKPVRWKPSLMFQELEPAIGEFEKALGMPPTPSRIVEAYVEPSFGTPTIIKY
jgi:hypothetical protein